MNPKLDLLHPYPFERLKALMAGIVPPAHLSPIALSIGEPKHQSPAFVKQALIDNIDQIAIYPTTKGGLPLRQAIADWCRARFKLPHSSMDPEQNVLPVTGTREALFAFTQAVVDTSAHEPLVVSPNPFYQIYEGAALLAGAELHFLDCTLDNGFIPDLSTVAPEVWERCQLLQICTPGNPTGAVMSIEQLQQAIRLADQYDFIIASDECYSEVYLDEKSPPRGILEACLAMGRNDFSRCVAFHSLSKRSNLPGLRSGFVAGDARLLSDFLRYRTYHGCAMSMATQAASAAAWSDETHVIDNRRQYREKFAAVTEILKDVLTFPEPTASFYLWPETPIDDTEFAAGLFAQQNVTLLPGRYLSRDTDAGNPGKGRVRMALVAETEVCIEAALRIKQYVQSLAD
jgi:N-succinyldiaminopimelate aminotransferase|tara:strand:+ start:3824 stop:5029 length:1206 start_codon:yes stop_codon:yes gene_type:complete